MYIHVLGMLILWRFMQPKVPGEPSAHLRGSKGRLPPTMPPTHHPAHRKLDRIQRALKDIQSQTMFVYFLFLSRFEGCQMEVYVLCVKVFELPQHGCIAHLGGCASIPKCSGLRLSVKSYLSRSGNGGFQFAMIHHSLQ